MPSQIYLLHIEVSGFDWLKLGYSRDIENRVKQYGLPTNAKIKLICTVQFPTGKEAHKVEASLHKKFNKQKLSKTKMSKFHQAQGASECYPAKLEEKIIEALEIDYALCVPVTTSAEPIWTRFPKVEQDI